MTWNSLTNRSDVNPEKFCSDAQLSTMREDERVRFSNPLKEVRRGLSLTLKLICVGLLSPEKLISEILLWTPREVKFTIADNPVKSMKAGLLLTSKLVIDCNVERPIKLTNDMQSSISKSDTLVKADNPIKFVRASLPTRLKVVTVCSALSPVRLPSVGFELIFKVNTVVNALSPFKFDSIALFVISKFVTDSKELNGVRSVISEPLMVKSPINWVQPGLFTGKLSTSLWDDRMMGPKQVWALLFTEQVIVASIKSKETLVLLVLNRESHFWRYREISFQKGILLGKIIPQISEGISVPSITQ